MAANISRKGEELCKPCLTSGHNETATRVCNICEEYLCESCATAIHTASKALKSHTLELLEETGSEEIIVCEPCEIGGIDKEAANYCEPCDEYLCDQCTNNHKRNKATKRHVPIEKQFVKLSAKKRLCDPCSVDSKRKSAIRFCQECEENLCNDCLIIHNQTKITKSHRPVLISELGDKQTAKKTGGLAGAAVSKDIEQNNKRGSNMPGKPSVAEVRADSVTISWSPPESFSATSYYQVEYKTTSNGGKWKQCLGDCNTTLLTVNDLQSKADYVFRVKVVCGDMDFPYSPLSDTITTSASPATDILEFSTLITSGNPTPSKYAPPFVEKDTARNENARTKKFELHTEWTHAVTQEPIPEKTIMLVGATGTGKSTLVDGLANYVLGVNWDDPFRFSILDMDCKEKDKVENQAVSQTEWITCYTIYPEYGGRLRCKLNIIDTPGFGDTRGLERDEAIVEQIRELFTCPEPKGIQCIDAVCFLIKAPDARLTAVQRYIFQSIMSIFGKDIEENICSLVTFADGIEPPVLAALKESRLPFGDYFTFNSSGLFAKNIVENNAISHAQLFWNMGMNSFKEFFDRLEFFETKSLNLTKDVLTERFVLETSLRNIAPLLDVGLMKVHELENEIKVIEDHKAAIEDNKNFEYEVTETKQVRKELPKGVHVTTCTNCHFTCHETCKIPKDEDKKKCRAMDNKGFCKCCPDKCEWTQHSNTPYIFQFVEERVKKTYSDMQQRYSEATGHLATQEEIISQMGAEIDELYDEINACMSTVRSCNERLAEIALRPNPLSMTDHIDLMIKAEELEKREGHRNRIDVLYECRQRAEITKDPERFERELEATVIIAEKKSSRKNPLKNILSLKKKIFGNKATRKADKSLDDQQRATRMAMYSFGGLLYT